MLNQAVRAVRVLNGIQKNFSSNVSVYILSFRSKQSQYIYWLSTMIEDRTRNMLGKPCGKFLVSENADFAWVVVAREARVETVNPLTVTVERGQQILIPCASPSRLIQFCQFLYCIRGMRFSEAKYFLT